MMKSIKKKFSIIFKKIVYVLPYSTPNNRKPVFLSFLFNFLNYIIFQWETQRRWWENGNTRGGKRQGMVKKMLCR